MRGPASPVKQHTDRDTFEKTRTGSQGGGLMAPPLTLTADS
jgi:hypothetical protein